MATTTTLVQNASDTHRVPAVTPWFIGPQSLKEAVASATAKGATVVSYDVRAGTGIKMYHVTADLEAFDRAVQETMAPEDRNAYEVLMEHQRVKPYFDLEYVVPAAMAEEAKGAFVALLRGVKARLREACATLLEVEDEAAEPRFVFLDGSRATTIDDPARAARLGLPGPGACFKCSCHIIIDGLAFERNTDLRPFVERALPPPLVALLRPEEAGNARWIPVSAAIDLKVYGKQQNFRMAGSCKRGTSVALRFMPELCDGETPERTATFLTRTEGLPLARMRGLVVVTSSPEVEEVRATKRARTSGGGALSGDRVGALQRAMQTVLRLFGDSHTEVQTLADVTEEALRFQCNHFGKGRPCLLSCTTHSDNNCLLFAKPPPGTLSTTKADLSPLDAYRIKYNCPSPSCSTSGILGELVWNAAVGAYACELYHPPHLMHAPRSTPARQRPIAGSSFGASEEPQVLRLASAESSLLLLTAPVLERMVTTTTTTASTEVEEEEETYDHINPRPDDESDNYYPMVKARFERFVFQVDQPVGYAFLGYSRYDRRIQILKRAELLHHFESAFFIADAAGGEEEERKKPFVTAWLRDPRKKKKLEIVYVPGSAPRHVFNSWEGFYADRLPPVPDAEVEGIVAPLVEHMRVVIANERENDLLFVLRWLAQIVRYPAVKTQVALFLYGVEGCGKNLIFDLVQAMLGPPNGFQTSCPERDIFGAFTTAFDKAVLIQTDEVRRCHDYEHLFKDFVTGETARSEHKGKDARMVPNRANFVFTSNTEGAFRISPYDRRCVLFHCAPRFVGDEAYFRHLQTYRREPRVIRAFFQYLRDRVDLPEDYQFQFHRPKTELYKEQQRLCIAPLDQFLSSVLLEFEANRLAAYRTPDGCGLKFRQALLWRMFQRFLEASGGERFDGKQNSFTKALLKRKGVRLVREAAATSYLVDAVVMRAEMVAGRCFDDEAAWLVHEL